ncbi:MAG: HEAT repeat domain-containing protein [Desulfuromonadaceae bacterium]|nr:HEAT repeat domain-containing protein [Desulfuromonadaceae bacterium]
MEKLPPSDIKDTVQTEFPWELFSQFLQLLNIYRKNILTYPPGHPLLEQSLTRADQAAESLFRKVDFIACEASQDKLHIAATGPLPANRVFTEFAQLLFKRGIVLLTMRCGLEKKEIGAFAALLNRKAEDFAAHGAEKIFQQFDFKNLEAREVDYSLIRVKEIEEEPDPTDHKSPMETIWGNFVSSLLQDPLLLEIQQQQLPPSTEPNQLADLLNQLFRSPETMPDTGIESSVASLLKDIAEPESEDFFILLLTVKRFEQFIALLNPYLRRRFQQYLLASEIKDLEGLKRVLKSFAAKTLFGILDEIEQKNISASENILALLERFSQARNNEKAEMIDLSPDIPLKEKIHALFREDISEHYGSEEYRLTLHSLLNDILPSDNIDEGIKNLLGTLSPQNVEMQQTRVILELFHLNDGDTSKASLRKKLSESFTFFLQTGNFSALVEIHKYLLSALKEGTPENIPYYRDMLNQFFSPEFISEVLETLSTWGKENLEDIRYLIRKNGVHFLTPLLMRLAEEPNRFLRSFIIEELIVTGRKVGPEPFVSHLGDKRWYFVRNMVTILRSLGDPSVLGDLRRVVGHPHAKVRREYIQALLQFRDPMADTLLLQDIRGQDEERKLCAIALAGFSSSPEIRENLLSSLQNKGFSDSEMEMKKLTIRSLAGMGHAESLPMFLAILRSTSLLNAKKLAALKLEIIKNLHLFPKSGAMSILNEFVHARDNELSLAARETLKKVK